MEVSTTPLRWKDLKTETQGKGVNEERKARASRTNVTRLDYLESGDVTEEKCKTPEKLIEALNEDARECQLRLFIVEDLSRDVIEALGDNLDIEPDFFREHIVDYAWCNVRDRWQDPPNLHIEARRQRWLQLRYVTARYYKTTGSFEKGVKEAERFNVLRRLDDDANNKAVWDDKGAIMGIIRTRASFWLRHADSEKGAVSKPVPVEEGLQYCSGIAMNRFKADRHQPLGVILLDPTIREGTPLWYGYRNWERTPGIRGGAIPSGPPRDSLFKDFIYWAKRTNPLSAPSSEKPASIAHLPIQTLLHLVCAEWLTIADYIRTRIGQIEWEVSLPVHFLNKGEEIDDALQKLHVWRRLVPLYREMLTDSLERVFHFPCHADGIDSPDPCKCALHKPGDLPKGGTINAFQADFTKALSYMEEYQRRIDRLTSVVTAIISIDDSRRGQDDNRNVARLTWLATFFIPLGYMASLFSMQSDISTLKDTYRLYFETALPLAAGTLGLALILGLPSVQRYVRRMVNSLKPGNG